MWLKLDKNTPTPINEVLATVDFEVYEIGYIQYCEENGTFRVETKNKLLHDVTHYVELSNLRDYFKDLQLLKSTYRELAKRSKETIEKAELMKDKLLNK